MATTKKQGQLPFPLFLISNNRHLVSTLAAPPLAGQIELGAGEVDGGAVGACLEDHLAPGLGSILQTCLGFIRDQISLIDLHNLEHSPGANNI